MYKPLQERLGAGSCGVHHAGQSVCKPLKVCYIVNKLQSWQMPGVIAEVFGTHCCFANFNKTARLHDLAV